MNNTLKCTLLAVTAVIFFVFTCPGATFSHTCHDPFRPKDHLILVPEESVIDIEKSGKFRMYVENSFETPIEMVELIVKSEAFGITIEPSTIALLIPGERSYFTVMLDLIEGKDSGEYPLKISVNAHRAEIMPSTEDIQVTVGESQSGLDGTYSSEDAESGTRLTSISEEEVGEIVIRVDDFVAKERTSIYLFPIVLLAVFFIWRRWTQK